MSFTNYIDVPDYAALIEKINAYSNLQQEYGAEGVAQVLATAEKSLQEAIEKLKALPIDQELSKKEPNDYASITALRPAQGGKFQRSIDAESYRKRLAGAFVGRIAGCILGAATENWEIQKMLELAERNDDDFPLTDYWTYVPDPYAKRYIVSPREDYTKPKMKEAPADDDIIYTILGMLAMEEHGLNLTTKEIGETWVKYLTMGYSAEEAALNNLKAGIDSSLAGETDNPYCEWIGADIRCDPWAYVMPGQPEKAAALAYQDAYLSHRRQGIYGAMYFAAAISAAFVLDDPVEALHIALNEIPAECQLAKVVKWALDISPQVKDYKDARALIDENFPGMGKVHTLNNACLTIFGITIGKTDYSKVISQTMAMGLDNDCTAATAGSIVGAVVGIDNISEHWYKPFNNKIRSYLNGPDYFEIDDVIERFIKLTADRLN